MTADAVTEFASLVCLLVVVLLPSSDIVGIAVGVADEPQAERSNAIIKIIKKLFLYCGLRLRSPIGSLRSARGRFIFFILTLLTASVRFAVFCDQAIL